MAAFPPPTLDLYLPQPLRDLIESCEQVCVAECCGLNAFDVSSAHLAHWLALFDTTDVGIALGQFERLAGEIACHRGPIRADGDHGCFNLSWQSPHDCLSYFADWRRAISEAIRGMDDPPFFNPAWMTETVVALRNGILAEKAFDRLPVLADAFEEAGCDNRFVLDHLRGEDDHTHMCWVLDLLSVGTK